MVDLLFVIGSLAVFFAVGQTLCRALPPAAVQRCELAAPVIGFGVFGIAITLLYRFGVPVGVAGVTVVVATALLALRRRPTLHLLDSGLLAILLAVAAVILLCLLPKWIGGAQFWVFQGNDQDQINYVAYSSAMRARSYADLMALTPATALDNNYLLGAQKMLTARPTVCLAFAALASLSGQPTADLSYDFQVVMQVNMLFAAAFLLINCFPASLPRCLSIAAALTVGFFLQYVFDIDAWSELASLPMVLVGMTAAIMAFTSAESRKDAAAHAALAAVATVSVLYFYPEAVLEFALPLLAILVLVSLRGDHGRGSIAVAAVAVAVALLLCVPFWRPTVEYLYRIGTVTVAQPVDWWVYFQRYLLGRDVDYFAELPPAAASRAIVYALMSLPVDFVAGLIGTYFVLPTAAVSLQVRVLWKCALWAGLALLLAGAARAALIEWRRDRHGRTSLILVVAVLCCLMPLAFALAGKLWAAGKALSMAAPLLFIALAAPLLTGSPARGWRAAAAAYVALHLGFGAYRTIAAANPSGIHYASPYPAVPDPAYKTELSWDLGAWRPALQRCRGASVDISHPVLERYVQMYLSELKLPWSSVRPLNTYYGTGKDLGLQPQLQSPDCVVTTRIDGARPGQTLIWLGRNRPLMSFLGGAADEVDLVDVAPDQIELTGLHAVETYGAGVLRWTDGDARLRIPNDAGHPARRLDLALWAVRLPGAHLRLQINDVDLFDGDLADGDIAMSVPLDRFATATALAIRIVSTTFSTPQDSRRLGLALRHLTLRR
jgi:hypothetical protein